MLKVKLPGSMVKCAAAAALAFGASGLACAAVPGFYLAGTVGQSSADLSQSDFDDMMIGAWEAAGLDVVDGTSDLDKSGMGYELAVGYQFNRHFAVEAAYVDLGDATYEADGVVTDGESDFDATTDLKVGVSGPSLTLIGMWPFAEKFALDARAGALFGKAKASFDLTLEGESGGDSASDSKTSLLLGAGVSWSFSETAAVRLGYSLVQEGVMDDADVGRISLGLRYAF